MRVTATGLMRVVVLVCAGLWAQVAVAQDTWVQIEAQPSQAEAEARAQAYAGVFPNVAGFRLGTGWYGIALGPYSPEEALKQIQLLKREGLIPQDSYIPEAGKLGERFWPNGPVVEPAPAQPQTATAEPSGVAPAAPGTVDGSSAVVTGDDAAATPEPTTPDASATAAPQVAVLADESPSEARAAEAALPQEDRQALQEALRWEGFYAGKIDGAIGPGTRNSMAAWQASKGYDETGILTARQRAELVDGWRGEKAAIGIAPVQEDEAGIAIDLPLNLVQFARYQPPFVQYDAKGDSGFRVLLISQQGDAATLFGLYDLMQTLEIVPLNGERERRDTSFVLTGKSDKLQSYTQAELQGGFIKGFTLVWRPEDGARAVRVLDAMKASFKPVGDRALDDSLGEPLAMDKSDLLSGLEVRKPRLSRSGFFVDGAGTVLTTADAAAGCGRVTLDGRIEADVAYSDPALGVAVLKPRVPLSPVAVGVLRPVPPRARAEIAVGGFPYDDRLPEPVATFGTLADQAGLDGGADRLLLRLKSRPGDAGGPVLDGTGAVAGMLLPASPPAGQVLPDDAHEALAAGALVRALDAGAASAGGATSDAEGAAGSAQGTAAAPNTGAAAGTLAAEDIARLARGMTVRVSCWD
jgi:peptidoglycan hydrolase-like protein with peptidoglycan-binding domain